MEDEKPSSWKETLKIGLKYHLVSFIVAIVLIDILAINLKLQFAIAIGFGLLIIYIQPLINYGLLFFPVLIFFVFTILCYSYLTGILIKKFGKNIYLRIIIAIIVLFVYYFTFPIICRIVLSKLYFSPF